MASVFGTNGTDLNLTGTADADDIFGWAQGGNETTDMGNDTLFGLAGNDHLFGGGGSDVLNGGAGADILEGGDADDVASYAGAAAGVFASLLTPTENTGDASGDAYVSVNGLRGTDFADTLTGDDNNNAIEGGGGGDIIYGLGGKDFLYSNLREGGFGTGDILVGGGGADVIYLSAGATVSYHTSPSGVRVALDLRSGSGRGGDAEGDLFGGFNGGRLHMIGSNFDDVLFGQNARTFIDRTVVDQLYGLDGNDELYGGDKYNHLDGGNGDDRMWGGIGNDLFIGGAGADLFTGGEGTDHAAFQQSAIGVTVNLTTGTGSGGDAQGDLYGSIEDITGSDFADQITGDNAANSLFGRLGNDLLWGMDGDDLLVGGAGADVLTGGTGNDTASYHSSDDGVRIDLLQKIGSWSDAEGDLFGSIENLNGSQFNDELYGDDAANKITANGGDDTIHGNGGNDEVDGGAGNDYLMGNDGDDLVFGRGGTDNMVGGGGADRFVFTELSDSLVSAPDGVSFFESAQGDKIDLSHMDANTNAAGNQAFAFIGSASFTGVAGQLRVVTNNHATTVDGDVNGDGVSDFRVMVYSWVPTQVTESDFIL